MRASDLTPVSVVAQEPRGIGQPPLDGSPQLCHWVGERTAYGASGTTPRPWSVQASLASIVGRAAETTQSTDAERQERPLRARLHHAKDHCELACLRGVEQPEHASDLMAWVICADRDLYRGWLSVPGPSAPPGAGGSVRGFWLDQAHADQLAVVRDALDDVSV